MVKNTPANAGDSELRLRSLVWEDLLKDRDSMVAQMVKASACNVGDPSSIPESGRSPGEGNGNALQYSCLENSMDRGAWKASVHRVIKSWTWLSIPILNVYVNIFYNNELIYSSNMINLIDL